MKKIPLTQGQFALIDDEDFKKICKYKWHAQKAKNNFYAKTNVTVNKTQKVIKMHHLIVGFKPVDHINGSGLDNRKSNLRLCTQSENCKNSKKRINCSSKFKGVTFEKKLNKWRANIMINKKYTNIGRFMMEKDAARAYNVKAIEFHGEFARLNAV